MAGDFSSDPWRAYVEFWGVMQATMIQQDAIKELHRVVLGSEPGNLTNTAWSKLRDMRTMLAGHPARRDRDGPVRRAFMGRSFGKYDRVTCEVWDDGTKQRTHPAFNLRRMIDDYDVQAAGILDTVLTTMKTKWP